MDIRTKLDLGSGDIRQGNDWIHIDIAYGCKPDYVWDVTKVPYPEEWADRDKFEIVRADNLIEHFDWEDRLKIFEEVFRILKPGGIFWIRVPNFEISPTDAVRDPTHKFPPFVPSSFDYFDADKSSRTKRWQYYGRLYGLPPFKRKKQVDNWNKIFIICELQKV